MERIFCIVLGYTFGLLQTAYIYGRIKGIDIRQHGSGNSGTTNALRILGKKAGLVVLAGDILKCMAVIYLCDYLFAGGSPEMRYLIRIYAGAGAVLGHNYPFYLRFKGGKGIASTGGVVLSFHPWFIAVGLLLFVGNFFITHYVSLGSILVCVGFFVQMVIMGQNGFFAEMTAAHLYEMYLITFLLMAMAIFKHRSNITRLWSGTERKTYIRKREKQEEEEQVKKEEHE
ncbi:MAG: glycerol-3-phosphate 1-O-acyltransferase PlsY [Lachnospiraceae bacterium]|jgi:glycerol-3-phosphate acyltransferase PlsY|nr:glycerol-3-phosphate 1-O-acyltransferase PlsY [Lachnospiraceae bacterium]